MGRGRAHPSSWPFAVDGVGGEGGSPLRVHQDKVEVGASAPCFQQLGPLLSLPFRVLAVGLGRCKRFL